MRDMATESWARIHYVQDGMDRAYVWGETAGGALVYAQSLVKLFPVLRFETCEPRVSRPTGFYCEIKRKTPCTATAPSLS